MPRTILAGDIGATKSNLALYDVVPGERPMLRREARYPSGDHPDLESMITRFLGVADRSIAAAAFGIAGLVVDGKVAGSNFPWKLEETGIRSALGCERVALVNDLQSTAYGTLFVGPEDLRTIQEGTPRQGNRAVIAAGTGLGQSFLCWDGKRHIPSATEGGHSDFAPRNDTEYRLMQFLAGEYPRVSYERVLSGPGLFNIFRFLREVLGRPVEESVAGRIRREDPNAVVGQAGVSGACATCEEAVEMFVSIYGAQAGNLALTVLATGGVYLGGGIVAKMVAKMTTGTFLESFLAKGRYVELMREMPVHILLDPKTSLIGAARAAADLLDSPDYS